MAKILVVDDDPDITEACTLFLEREGFEVVSANSRSSGMASIEGAPPDLVILDVMMEQPDDGMAMAQDLRRNGFTNPILMLTSISKVSGLEYGRDNDVVPVDEFQEKPVDPATLIEKVKRLLAAKEG
ncbi:MAG: response regulator [Candidatus Hydrogenedentes bacterium]|nr:response regulator [Candidatus Hydrogenedentota bacterium]